MPPPMKLYEVYVEGETKHREVCTSPIEANRMALRIAEDELRTTEVRPVTAQEVKDRAKPKKPKVTLGDKTLDRADGWQRAVEVDGVPYFVGIDRGKRVRIPFKPRGPDGYGYHWHGWVRNRETGKIIWSDQVNKSNGCRGLLRFAGVLPPAEPA